MPDRPPGLLADDVAETAGIATLERIECSPNLYRSCRHNLLALSSRSTTEFLMFTRLAKATCVRAKHHEGYIEQVEKEEGTRIELTGRSYDVGVDTDLAINRLARVNSDISSRIYVEAVVPCLVNSSCRKTDQVNLLNCFKLSIGRRLRMLITLHVQHLLRMLKIALILTWILWLRRILESMKTTPIRSLNITRSTHVDRRRILCPLARGWHLSWPNALHCSNMCWLSFVEYLDLDHRMFHLEYGRPNVRHRRRNYSLNKRSSRAKIKR